MVGVTTPALHERTVDPHSPVYNAFSSQFLSWFFNHAIPIWISIICLCSLMYSYVLNFREIGFIFIFIARLKRSELQPWLSCSRLCHGGYSATTRGWVLQSMSETIKKYAQFSFDLLIFRIRSTIHKPSKMITWRRNQYSYTKMYYSLVNTVVDLLYSFDFGMI